MITSWKRGHKIVWHDGDWYYADSELLSTDERPCVRCNKMPTPEGHDACLGHIQGVKSACCGHGVHAPIIARNCDAR